MLIGELARQTGVAARTLRFYEDRDLLPPPDRTSGGYRTYPDQAVDRVRFIKDAQAAGFTLAEIREILTIRDGGNPPCSHVTELVDVRLAEVAARMAELVTIRRQLEDIAAKARAFDPTDCGDYCDLITER